MADERVEVTKGNGLFPLGADQVTTAYLIPPLATINQPYTIHPVAQLFPWMTDKEFGELKISISRNGQLQPIVANGNEILDGRCRLRACKELGLEPKFMQYSELGLKIHPAAWAFTTNLRRRNLTADQKLAVFSAYNSWARTRRNTPSCSTQAQAGASQENSAHVNESRPNPDASNEPDFQGRKQPAKSPAKRPRGRPAGSGGGRRREQLAQAADQTQYRARQMLKLRKHLPELAIEVEEGRVTLKDATRQLKERLKDQLSAGRPSPAKFNPEAAWKRYHKSLESARAAWPTDHQADLHNRLCDYMKLTWPQQPIVDGAVASMTPATRNDGQVFSSMPLTME